MLIFSIPFFMALILSLFLVFLILQSLLKDTRMQNNPSKMSICLWFDDRAEEAVNFYSSVFKNIELGTISRFNNDSLENHEAADNPVILINFKLMGINIMALNGGLNYKFTEAMSLVVSCENQAEIDLYWSKLCEEGSEGNCGWLKDKFGVSWQIVPEILSKYMMDANPEKVKAVTEVFMQMKKLDINKLKSAFESA